MDITDLPGPQRRACELAGGPPVLWDHLTWPAIAALRESGPGLVVLPVGATEQHGPHLGTGCDNAIGSAVCAYASARTGVPLLPPLSFGVSMGHTHRWPGTLSLTHETLARSVRQLVGWLLEAGWARVLIVSSHVGNDAALRCAVDRLRTEHLGRLLIGLADTFHLTPELRARMSADAADLHANLAETQLMLFLQPDAVDREAMGTADDPDRSAGLVFSHPVGATSTNGVTGAPSTATAEAGRKLLIELGEALAAKLEAAKTEQPPLDPGRD